MEKINKFYLF